MRAIGEGGSHIPHTHRNPPYNISYNREKSNDLNINIINEIASFRDCLPMLWNRVISRPFADVMKSRHFATVCRCYEIVSFRDCLPMLWNRVISVYNIIKFEIGSFRDSLPMLWNRVISRLFANVMKSRHFGFYNIIKVEIASFRDRLPMLWNRVISRLVADVVKSRHFETLPML